MKRMISMLLVSAMLLTSTVTVGAAQPEQTPEVTQQASEASALSEETTAPAETAPAQEAAPAASETPAATEQSSQTATEQSSQAATEQSSQAATEQSSQAATEQSSQAATEQSSQAASESSSAVTGTLIQDENNDKVEIKENDKPYLSLGADLSDAQRQTVLNIMGIDPANLGNYDVVYVTNSEEHKYLDSYVSSAQIGSISLSSVVIVQRKAGSGLNISTNNINYCTVGMYKNALTTAGVKDADIIIAGPTPISGTAALVGIFKAYNEMTGNTISDSVVDAAMNEIVITGKLEDSINGLSDAEVEEFVAYVKSLIAKDGLKDEASINSAIDEACAKYNVTLTADERQQLVDLLLKISALGIDLNGLVDYAANMYKNGADVQTIISSISGFFTNIFTSIGNFFNKLFS